MHANRHWKMDINVCCCLDAVFSGMTVYASFVCSSNGAAANFFLFCFCAIVILTVVFFLLFGFFFPSDCCV